MIRAVRGDLCVFSVRVFVNRVTLLLGVVGRRVATFYSERFLVLIFGGLAGFVADFVNLGGVGPIATKAGEVKVYSSFGRVAYFRLDYWESRTAVGFDTYYFFSGLYVGNVNGIGEAEVLERFLGDAVEYRGVGALYGSVFFSEVGGIGHVTVKDILRLGGFLGPIRS